MRSFIIPLFLILFVSILSGTVFAGDFLDFDFDFTSNHYGGGYNTYPYYNPYLSSSYGYGVPSGYYEVPFDTGEAFSPFLADRIFSHLDQQPLVPYHFQQTGALYSFIDSQYPCSTCSYFSYPH